MSAADIPEEILRKIRKAMQESGRSNTFLEPLNRDDPEIMSYADHGLAWVERVVRNTYPDAIIYSPLAASALYGNYFQEFDNWRTERDATRRYGSFQGVLIRTDDLRASFVRIAKEDDITGWYGRKYEGNEVTIFCIDRGLVVQIAESFYHIVASQTESKASLFRWAAASGVDNHALPAAESILAVSARELETIDEARDAFRKAALELLEVFGPSRATQALATFVTTDNPGDEVRNWIWNYCESVALHFVMGHEFGHYVFKVAGTDYAAMANGVIAEIMNDQPNASQNSREESFCDFVALDNCLYQMLRFEVPPVFTVFGTAWTLALLRGVLVSEELRELDLELALRALNLAKCWKRLSVGKWQSLADAAGNAHTVLGELGCVIGARIPVLGRYFRYSFE